jgi:putative transposase
MGRAWRIEYEGALYHVLSRGNDRRNIVVDNKDLNLFLDTAGECRSALRLIYAPTY